MVVPDAEPLVQSVQSTESGRRMQEKATLKKTAHCTSLQGSSVRYIGAHYPGQITLVTRRQPSARTLEERKFTQTMADNAT